MSLQTITEVMQQHAKDAVEEASAHYRIRLDLSVESLSEVDRILQAIHLQRDRGLVARVMRRKLELAMRRQAVMWGGYAGETIRQHVGGQWHTRPDPGGSPHITLRVNGTQIAVVNEIFKRLMEGPATSLMEVFKRAGGESAGSGSTGSGSAGNTSADSRPTGAEGDPQLPEKPFSDMI